jgi:hypothetical protein
VAISFEILVEIDSDSAVSSLSTIELRITQTLGEGDGLGTNGHSQPLNGQISHFNGRCPIRTEATRRTRRLRPSSKVVKNTSSKTRAADAPLADSPATPRRASLAGIVRTNPPDHAYSRHREPRRLSRGASRAERSSVVGSRTVCST